MTIEQKVAAAILEKSISSIEIDGQVYEIASPSLATLILVSEVISTLPIVEKLDLRDASERNKAITSALHYAKDFSAIADIAAILILGANHLTEEVKVKRFFGLFTHTVKVNKRAELRNLILTNVRPTVLFKCVVQRLRDMEIVDFFLITTSLSEANLLRPTREVEDED